MRCYEFKYKENIREKKEYVELMEGMAPVIEINKNKVYVSLSRGLYFSFSWFKKVLGRYIQYFRRVKISRTEIKNGLLRKVSSIRPEFNEIKDLQFFERIRWRNLWLSRLEPLLSMLSHTGISPPSSLVSDYNRVKKIPDIEPRKFIDSFETSVSKKAMALFRGITKVRRMEWLPYMKLNAHVRPNSPAVRKAVNELEKYSRDRVELARILYMFVRDHIRYPFEIAPRMPVFGQFPEETMWYGWGICQDSANLLASLYLAAGYRVAYVYPFRGTRILSVPVPTDFHTLHSYVAVYLPEYSKIRVKIGRRTYRGWVFLDPTGRMGTIGFIPFAKLPRSDLPGGGVYNDMLLVPVY